MAATAKLLVRILLFSCICLHAALGDAAAAQGLPADCRYALIFVIDGIPNQVFATMLQNGELPNFQEHIYNRGIQAAHQATVFPPLTFPAMASIFSGQYPSRHGIPNFFWVSRDDARYKNYLSIDLADFQCDISRNSCLLFQYLPCDRTLEFGLALDIGGDYTRDLTVSLLDVFRESRDIDFIEKAVMQEHTIEPGMFVHPLKMLSLLNPASESNLISLINPLSHSSVFQYVLTSFSERERFMRRQIPRAVLYYEWATDHLGHEDGTWSDDVHESLVKADTQFGRLVRVYQRAGLYEQTFFFLLSDHGQIPTVPKYVSIDRIFKKCGFKTRFISHELIAEAGLSSLLRLPSLFHGSGSIKGYNCILGTAGGGAVIAYFSNYGGTSASSWEKLVYYEDLLHYPVTDKSNLNVAEFINAIEGISFFFVREGEFVEGKPHVARIVSSTGSSLISSHVINERPVLLKYQVVEGVDPLGYSQDPSLATFIAQGYHDDREWLRATGDTEYPDALVQIAQFLENPRSGTVVIIPDDYHSFNARTYSKHGSLSAGEMLTTFAASGPGIRKGTLEYSRTVDFTPTFLYLMGQDVPLENFDGVILKNILSCEQ